MGLTVREHLVLAHRARVARADSGGTCSTPARCSRRRRTENEQVDGLLELLRLTRVAKAPVAALPLGVIRLVEVGRALASEPHVAAARRAPLRSRHEGVGEPALGLPADRRPERARRSRWSSSSTTWPRSSPCRTRSSCSTSASGSPRAPPRRSATTPRFGPPTWATTSRRSPGRAGRRHARGHRCDQRSAGSAAVTEPLLEVEDLDVRYGTVPGALRRLASTVAPGTVLAVLGANGAGKSTLARAVSGLVPPTGGRVLFDGQGHHRASPPTASASSASPTSPRAAASFPASR